MKCCGLGATLASVAISLGLRETFNGVRQLRLVPNLCPPLPKRFSKDFLHVPWPKPNFTVRSLLASYASAAPANYSPTSIKDLLFYEFDRPLL